MCANNKLFSHCDRCLIHFSLKFNAKKLLFCKFIGLLALIVQTRYLYFWITLNNCLQFFYRTDIVTVEVYTNKSIFITLLFFDSYRSCMLLIHSFWAARPKTARKFENDSNFKCFQRISTYYWNRDQIRTNVNFESKNKCIFSKYPFGM